MARKIFISYQHEDQMKAKGLNLLRWNKNVDLEFVGRHLLDPVDSRNRDYIRSCIKEQLLGTSVTVVLIGKETAQSTWVADEIQWSQEKGNGILGIRIDNTSPVPEQLKACGAEIIDWDAHAFADAIERAAAAAGRIRAMATASAGGSCGR
jgi:MTH538 TIR-like domain (DUF1863)